MKKINIVKKSRDFTRIIKNQKAFKNQNFVIYLEHTDENLYHFGVTVSKKIGNAVVRNKIKRRIKSILDKKNYKNGFNCIIIVRKSVLDLSYQELEESLFDMMKKMHIEGE